MVFFNLINAQNMLLLFKQTKFILKEEISFFFLIVKFKKTDSRNKISNPNERRLQKNVAEVLMMLTS